MELGLSNTLLAGDARLIDHIVGQVKSQGIFDQFRKECIADVDTKPAYQNLRTRVEGSVNSFLNKQTWKPDLNKNQLRENLRKHIHDASYLDAGVERIVDQVVNPKVYSVFMSQIEDVVYKFLGIERPKAKEKNGACGLKDLLPKDLDPVSPESDKNSYKDLSLESLDTNDNLDGKQDDRVCNEQKQDEEMCADRDKSGSENGHISSEDKTLDDTYRALGKTGSNTNLNISGKSDDKIDEEEEDSPTFEPIDIMNLNESNMSNDSHLSGISELTSHRSRSPDFSNELSRDNFDYSNQDSQLSKVSSDSRLSIVTDFGSNHGLTPIQDTSKDELTKDKYESKINKDNFRAIREFDSSRNKSTKNNFEFAKSKDTQDYKDSRDMKTSKSMSFRENSRDAMDSSVKDKYEHKSSKEKGKDSESIRSKSAKEKISSKDSKYYRDKSNEKKKTSSHSSTKYDKHSKSKSKDKIDQTKEVSEKAKDTSETLKDTSKFKDEKLLGSRETDRKDNVNKEVKDLKDLYKEKIRELREKKELTEKEKLNKDKDKLNKEVRDRKDSPKDRGKDKSSKKEHKGSSSSSSSSSKNLSVSYHESKNKTTAEKIADGKDRRSDSKDKVKREHNEKRLSKESKNKTHFNSKTDLSDKSDKSDLKRTSRSEKDDKTMKIDAKRDIKISSEKTNGKKDAKNHLQSKSSDRNEKLDGRKDSKSDSQSKDKKRREDKKSKAKDDHSSLRKNSNDRRSTDRDGSNGSNSKTSPPNNSNSNATSQKSGTSSLTKENQISNSSSETSDSIEETQMNNMKSLHQNCKLSHRASSQQSPSIDKSHLKLETDDSGEVRVKQEEAYSHQADLPLRKRQLSDEENDKSGSSEIKVKKPKFAKNIHEAKKLMKIRKQMEKQKTKEDKKPEKKIAQDMEQTGQSSATTDVDSLASMPDDERVQIIEISDEEYEEPYPESSLTLDERAIIMLGAEPCAKNFLGSHSDAKATLSNMELCIRESLSEIVSNMPLGTAIMQNSKEIAQSDPCQRSSTCSHADFSTSHIEDTKNLQATEEVRKSDSETVFKEELLKDIVADTEKSLDNAQKETLVSQERKEDTILEKLESALQNNDESTGSSSTEENAKTREYDLVKTRDDAKRKDEEPSVSQTEVGDKVEVESYIEKRVETCTLSKADDETDNNDRALMRSPVSDNNEDCRYFKTDNERSNKFFSFLESLELENSSLEDIIESLGGKVVSSVPKSMAPPLSKAKRSSSPLSDILVNNSNNNNDGHKLSPPVHEDVVHVAKKRKLFATSKKLRFQSLCNTQGISNGENFIMPLSPDSDVSATSEKMSTSNVIKEEKSRNRSNQRYSSDDLYKPRPLFSSSSRRSRRSHQA